MLLPEFYVDDVIKRALAEDINYIDLATDLLIPEDDISTAEFVSKAEGVLAGIECALRTFTFIDSSVKCEIFIHDGEKVKKGDVILFALDCLEDIASDQTPMWIKTAEYLRVDSENNPSTGDAAICAVIVVTAAAAAVAGCDCVHCPPQALGGSFLGDSR